VTLPLTDSLDGVPLFELRRVLAVVLADLERLQGEVATQGEMIAD
jgi:hypothetical protein